MRHIFYTNFLSNRLRNRLNNHIVVFLYMILGTFSRDITVRHVPKKDFNSLSQLKKPCHGEKA